MGFFSLQAMVSRSASTADISNTTRPPSVFPSVHAISTRVWWITRSNQTSAAMIGQQGTVKAPKKGPRSTPEF